MMKKINEAIPYIGGLASIVWAFIVLLAVQVAIWAPWDATWWAFVEPWAKMSMSGFAILLILALIEKITAEHD